MPGVKRIQISGRQVILAAHENVEAIVELSKGMQPVSVDVAPIGLRELFLETVKEDA
jgi:ABC-2 type transport system ATP-binding protein